MEHVSAPSETGGADATRRDPLAKSFQVMNLLVDHPGATLGVREIATLLDLAPSTCHRILTVLTEAGYVDHRGDGRYSVGFELQRLAWRVAARFPAPAVAEPVLRELAETTGETSALGLFDPVRNQITFVAEVQTQHRLRYMAELFRSIPIHAGASGLSILAFLEPKLRDEILHAPDGLDRFTDATLTTPEALNAAIAEIRSKGYAITHGQRALGAVGIAAPFWGDDATVLGNIMVTIPEQRFDPALEPSLSAAVLRAAAAMTHLVGGRAPLRT